MEHHEKEAERKTTILRTEMTKERTEGRETLERVKDAGATTEEEELVGDKAIEADVVAGAITEVEKVGDMATGTTDDAMVEADGPFKGKHLIALLVEIDLETALMAGETIVAIETASPDVAAVEQEVHEIMAVAVEIACLEIEEEGMNTKTKSSCLRTVDADVIEAPVDVEGEENLLRTAHTRELDTRAIMVMRDTTMMAIDTMTTMDTLVKVTRSPRNEEEVEVAGLLAEEEVAAPEGGLITEKNSQRTEAMKEALLVTMPTQTAANKVTLEITLLLWSRLPIPVAAEVTDTRLEAEVDLVGVEEAVAAPSPEERML